MKRNNWPSMAMFLMGLFSQTQIRFIGYLDISEAFCYIAGPILFILDWPKLQKNGFGLFLGGWFLCVIGAYLSSLLNDTPTPLMLRGIASPVSVFCIACVFHHILSQDLKAFRWFFLGAAISGIISVFLFQRGASISSHGDILVGDEAIEKITSYSLFWLVQIGTWLNLPIQMFYLKIPRWYSVVFGCWYMVYGIFAAESRSGLLVAALFLFLVLIVGKTRRSMMFIKKHFIIFSIAFILVGLTVATFYKYAAIHGALGEEAQKKYLRQTRGRSGFMNLLRGGRADFFMGLSACVESPISGWGPWARESKGVVYSYIQKYGDDQALADYHRIIQLGGTPGIPSHSYVITFWLWYGILGLICMLYVGWLYFSTLKNRMHVVPELYGFFAFALPNVIWAWFFSPFSGRTYSTLLMVLCLFTKAIDEGRFRFVSDADMLDGRSLKFRV